MKDKIKGFVCGILVCALSLGFIVLAQGQWKTIDVIENDVTVIVNGQQVGESNFVYDGTTYLPVRAVAESLGKEVQYDDATKTATIVEKGSIKMDISTENKYTPPDELLYDKDNIYIMMDKNGIYYITVGGINYEFFTNGYHSTYNNETDEMTFTKDGKEPFTIKFDLTEINNRGGITYDYYVENVQPLNK